MKWPVAETGLEKFSLVLDAAATYRAFDYESIKALILMSEAEGPLPEAISERHLHRWPETTVRPVSCGDYEDAAKEGREQA